MASERAARIDSATHHGTPDQHWLSAPFRFLSIILTLALLIVTLPPPAVAAASTVGYDVSFPDCGRAYASASGFTLVGVNGGRAFTYNRCFASEYATANAHGESPAIYMNLNYPGGSTFARGQNGPRGVCSPADAACITYNYGYNAAQDAVHYARGQGANAHVWWLDIETDNYWSGNLGLNAQVIQGAIDSLRANGKAVGIYSITQMWAQIAGGFAPGVPNWVAQTHGSISPLAFCSPYYAFGGGKVILVQHWNGYRDLDYACAGMVFPTVFTMSASGKTLEPSGSPLQPIPLNGPVQGTLIGRTGGASAFYSIPYSGDNSTATTTLYFWPTGPVTTGALFIHLYQNGDQLATVRGTDAQKSGQLTFRFSSPAAGPILAQITSYDDPSVSPPINYMLKPGT